MAAVLLGMNKCGGFSLLSALQIVGVLKIAPLSCPWLEVDIGKIMCPLFCSSKYGYPMCVCVNVINGVINLELPYFEEQKRGHIILPMSTSNHG